MTAPRPTIAFVPREVFSTTRQSLETLYERTTEPFDLVCVDGGSPPEVADYLKLAARVKGFTLLRTEEYLTPNEARNIAAEWALANLPAPHIVFVDNDVLVAPGWLEAIVRCAEETGAGVVGPAYYEHLPELSKLHMFGGECRIEVDKQGRRTYLERHHLPHVPVNALEESLSRTETELIEYHTVLVTRALLETTGMLDEGLFCHAEHGDLCLTAREAGFSVWVEPDSKITYAPPRRLDPADREFFFLRWSEAWLLANQRRMIEKWNLDHMPNTNGRGLEWVREHRRLGLETLRRLRRTIGSKWTNTLNKRCITPLEWRLNRRRFPIGKYDNRARPTAELLYTPILTSARAAA